MARSRNFTSLLEAQMADGKLVCVGLDTDTSKLKGEDQLGFNRRIVDETMDIAQSYKLQCSFYECELGDPLTVSSYAISGLEVLAETIRHINEVAPHIPTIVDFKRGDIGNTNNGYIKLAFELLGADAVTVHAHMGRVDGMQPFLDVPNKGIIIVCRTSNKGGAEFQDLVCQTWRHKNTGFLYSSIRHAQIELGDEFVPSDFTSGPTIPLYEFMAHRVNDVWNSYAASCGIVVGATQPDELKVVRGIVGDMPILIPGLGKQEGEAELTVRYGMNSSGGGMVVNNSRGIIFADDPRKAALEFHEKLTTLRDAALSTQG